MAIPKKLDKTFEDVNRRIIELGKDLAKIFDNDLPADVKAAWDHAAAQLSALHRHLSDTYRAIADAEQEIRVDENLIKQAGNGARGSTRPAKALAVEKQLFYLREKTIGFWRDLGKVRDALGSVRIGPNSTDAKAVSRAKDMEKKCERLIKDAREMTDQVNKFSPHTLKLSDWD
jgi:hypothetical protein